MAMALEQLIPCFEQAVEQLVPPMTTHELELKPFPPHKKSPLTSRSPFTSRVEPGFVVLIPIFLLDDWVITESSRVSELVNMASFFDVPLP